MHHHLLLSLLLHMHGMIFPSPQLQCRPSPCPWVSSGVVVVPSPFIDLASDIGVNDSGLHAPTLVSAQFNNDSFGPFQPDTGLVKWRVYPWRNSASKEFSPVYLEITLDTAAIPINSRAILDWAISSTGFGGVEGYRLLRASPTDGSNFDEYQDCAASGFIDDESGWLAGSTVTPVGGISLWQDQSGNGRDESQATIAAQPLFLDSQLNGYPAIRFDGADDSMSTAAFAAQSTATIMCVLKRRSTGVGPYKVICGDTGGALLQTDLAGKLSLNAGTVLSGITVVPANTPLLVTAVFNGANSKIRLNRAAEVSGDAGSHSFAGLTLCQNSAPTFSDNDILAVKMWNSVLTAAQITAAENALATKYGL